MRTKWFLKKMLLYTAVVMIPLLILGLVSDWMLRYYTNQEIDRNNSNLLGQVQENVETVFSEFDNLILNYEMNATIISTLRSVLGSNEMSYDEYKALQIVDSYTLASVSAKDYIHSIVVYYRNNSMQYYSSVDGVSAPQPGMATTWYNSFLNHPYDTSTWTELNTTSFPIGKNGPVLSIYKNLYTTGKLRPDGVVVLNVHSSYFSGVLDAIETVAEQNIIVADAAGEIVMSKNALYLDEMAGGTLDRTKYSTYQRVSDRNGWTYVSIAPNSVLYRASGVIRQVLILTLLLSLVLGAMLSYSVTRADYARVRAIIDLLSEAESGMPIPPMPEEATDEYGIITRNIVKTFLDQHYLKLELERQTLEKKNSELLALQAQMNPHFLFNTIETINWKVVAANGFECDASVMLQDLSQMLKYSVYNFKDKVTLYEEIDNAKRYVAILGHRYKDKFTMVWDNDDGALECYVIKLLIQPLIENSVYHGIKEQPGHSTIRVRARLRGEQVHISVTDTGVGITPERLKKLRVTLMDEVAPVDDHIGLINTSKRLRLAYGAHYRLSVVSTRGRGTSVRIVIPAHRDIEDLDPGIEE